MTERMDEFARMPVGRLDDLIGKLAATVKLDQRLLAAARKARRNHNKKG